MQIFSPDNKVLFFFPASGLSSHVSLSWLRPLAQWRMQWWELTSCLLVSEGRVFCYKFDVSVDSVFVCLFVFFGRGLFMKLKLFFFSFSLKRILKMVIIWFYRLSVLTDITHFFLYCVNGGNHWCLLEKN